MKWLECIIWLVNFVKRFIEIATIKGFKVKSLATFERKRIACPLVSKNTRKSCAKNILLYALWELRQFGCFLGPLRRLISNGIKEKRVLMILVNFIDVWLANMSF